jgi:cyclin-dependent kinase 10
MGGLVLPGKCRDINDFEKLNRLGEGSMAPAPPLGFACADGGRAAYGVVHRSLDRRNNTIVALKQVRVFENDRGNGIPITALREISILKSLRHVNIISVLDVAVSRTDLDDVYMVEEYAEQVGEPFCAPPGW